MGIAMLEYFWKQQDDIPAGMGYPLFGIAHLLSVAITLFFVVLMAGWIVGLDGTEKRRGRVLLGIPLFMVALEIFKDLFLVRVGRFGIGYLPLHVCSIGIFVFLLRELGARGLAQSSRGSDPGQRSKLPQSSKGHDPGLHPKLSQSSKKHDPGRNSQLPHLVDIFGEIAFVLIMPASFMALIFADWTVYYPVLNFMNIYSYIWHGLLILYPVALWLTGEVSLSIRHIHYVIVFLCVVTPPIYAFDKRFGCNYFFVNWPVADSPLSWLASFMGNPGYLAGYAALTLAVILLMYLAVWVIDRYRKAADV